MHIGDATSQPLLERDEELRRIERVLDATAAGEGAVVAITAPAGLGKTRLLGAALDTAGDRGAQTLVARGTELESAYAFGVARQLLEARLVTVGADARAALLGGAARHASAVFDLDPDGVADPDVHATLHSLYWLLLNLAAEGPMVVAVDDLQCADEPSLRWLAYVARRLEKSGIVLLVTVRTEVGSDPVPAIDEIVGQSTTLRIEPSPLSADATGELLGRALEREPEQAFVDASRTRTGGNPFLLSELIAELASEGVEPVSASATALESVVPDRVSQTVRARLGRLSEGARALAPAVAVLGDGTDAATAGELAGLDAARAAEAAAELTTAQLLDDAPLLRFRHPLLRSAVEEGLPAIERGRRHGQAARVLAERGASDGRVASHLLASPPEGGDPWVVERLRTAASSARAQGASKQAANLLRRALAEGLDRGRRRTVLRELGEAELGTLDPEAADHLREAHALTDDPAERATQALALGFAEYYAGGSHAQGVQTLLAACEEARGLPELREEWLHLEALLALVSRYDLETEERTRGRIDDLAEGLTGATSAERLVRATARSLVPCDTADDLYRSTVEATRAVEARPWPDVPQGIGDAAMYVHAGRPDEAARTAEAMLDAARISGSPMGNAIGLVARALAALDVGDLRAAEADVDAAYQTFAELDDNFMRSTTAGFRALVWTEMGELEQAETLFAEYDLLGTLPERMFFNPMLFHRGSLRLAQRRFAEAEADFRELGRRNGIWGITRPTPPWRSALALALLAQGKRGDAAESAAEELALARVWGTPKAIAAAARALALTCADDEAIDGLAEAVELLEDTPWKLDRAKARLDLGSALRRLGQRRRAREALAQAMDEAHACGAEPLAERAADELRASGARPRRRAISGFDALTPSEVRVASLAAEGKTNRQIAEELFVTMATVETHLSRCYRKLDLDGREGLADALTTSASRT